ncbi:hypothetical protein KGQ34_01995 [Patescibacteria group bacterium]|nr:hypothetical protein [Patescibacteria group bacterium]
MAYQIKHVDLKREVYKLIRKEREITSCTAKQLLEELERIKVHFEEGRSYEQLTEVLSQLLRENKIKISVTNVFGNVLGPDIEFESVKKVKRR